MNTLDSRGPAYGAFVLRVASGLAFLAHGLYLKVFVFTMPGTVGFFESLGLPGFTAWLTVIGETVGGLMLILGIGVRVASLWLIAILLLGNIAMAGYLLIQLFRLPADAPLDALIRQRSP